MSATLEQIEREALALPAEKRARLADTLWESLDAAADTGLTAEWTAEVKRRCSEIDEGTVKLIPADEAIREARERLKQNRG